MNPDRLVIKYWYVLDHAVVVRASTKLALFKFTSVTFSWLVCLSLVQSVWTNWHVIIIPALTLRDWFCLLQNFVSL